MDSSRLPLHALLTVSMQISLIKGYVASSAKAQKVEPYSIVHTSPYTSISRDINDIATVGIPRIENDESISGITNINRVVVMSSTNINDITTCAACGKEGDGDIKYEYA